MYSWPCGSSTMFSLLPSPKRYLDSDFIANMV
jgi:hypothetical protein